MIHPSYNELIEIINQGNEDGENPQINSRYSIVMAAAKRARQLIDGDQALVSKAPINKPLTIAVEEIRRGKIKITEEGVDDFQFHLRNSENNTSDLVYDEDGDSQDGDVDPDAEENEDEDEEEDESEADDAE
jgi:DNA-directed RNA polymerase subunit omega